MIVFLRLFYEFFKVGLFAVGGGMATIPFLYDIADATGWFTHNDLINMLAVSESTPGPIGINTATYVGFTVGKEVYGYPGAALGAVAATLGLVMPSIIIIMVIASFLERFQDNPTIKKALYGLRPASTGLIAAAGMEIAAEEFFCFAGEAGGGTISFNGKGLMLSIALWILTNKVSWSKKLHPIVFIGISAAIGVLFGF